MWFLCLNDMRFPKIEILARVCKASSKEELQAFIEKEKCELYENGGWHKSFRKGGPLEWYNPPYYGNESHHFVYVGTEEECVNNARRSYQTAINSVPSIESLYEPRETR